MFLFHRLSTGACVRFAKAPKQKEPRPTVVVVHDWGVPIFSSPQYKEVRDFALSRGYHCLSLSLRGHEAARGDKASVTHDTHLEDVGAAFRFLGRQDCVDKMNIVAIGVGYGAYLLSVLAPVLPLKGLSLRAPQIYPKLAWRAPALSYARDSKMLSEWRMQMRRPHEVFALTGIQNFSSYLLIVNSQKDEQVPPAVIKSYVSFAVNATITIVGIRGAKHQLNALEHARYLHYLGCWLTEVFASRPHAS